MKLSAKRRYGARAMPDLALYYGESPILLKDIAKRRRISERYLGGDAKSGECGIRIYNPGRLSSAGSG